MGLLDLCSVAYGYTLDACAWACGIGRELGEDDESLRLRCIDKLQALFGGLQSHTDGP